MSVDELEHRITPTHGSDDVGHVRNRSSTGSSDVEDLLAGGDVDVVQSTEDTSGQLGAERVPHAVFDLLGGQLGVGRRRLDGDALLAVDRITGDEVAGDKKMLLSLHR